MNVQPDEHRSKLGLDSGTKSLLRRIADEWVWPRRRELLVVLLLMIGLAAVTGSYPRLIKYAFDELPKGDIGVLYSVAAPTIHHAT